MIDFNLNDTVWVQLTEFGLAEHKRGHEVAFGEVGSYKPPPTDEDGWSKWQLWELIGMFGGVMRIGFNSPFETTIRLDLDASLEAKDGI